MRNTKKKALYEVISRAKINTSYEQLHPQGTTGSASTGDGSGSMPSVIRWVRKPRFVQINAGRIEFSMPYQLGVAVLLGAVLVIVVTFRLGQWLGGKDANVVTVTRQMPANRPSEQSPKVAESAPARTTSARQPAATGRNKIVIQMYQVRTHLEPVKEYFDKLGVETEIIERNNWYYLVTKNKYDNIDKPGTDGFAAKQKIVELGSGYKAPPGYETFGTKPFSGAFGMKFEE